MRLLAVASVTVGMILYPLQFSMIQMLEGYWGASPLAVYVRLLATRRYDRRRASWDDKQQSDADTKSAVSKKTQLGALGRVRRSETENRRARAIYVDALYSLPKPDRMMPTRLRTYRTRPAMWHLAARHRKLQRQSSAGFRTRALPSYRCLLGRRRDAATLR